MQIPTVRDLMNWPTWDPGSCSAKAQKHLCDEHQEGRELLLRPPPCREWPCLTLLSLPAWKLARVEERRNEHAEVMVSVSAGFHDEASGQRRESCKKSRVGQRRASKASGCASSNLRMQDLEGWRALLSQLGRADSRMGRQSVMMIGQPRSTNHQELRGLQEGVEARIDKCVM